MPYAAPDARHFRLLRGFGQSTTAKAYNPDEKQELWATSCKVSQIPVTDLQNTITEWRKYIAGGSDKTGIAVNGDIDPNYVSIAITFNKRIQAAHTLPTKTLLSRLLKSWERAFPDRETFLWALLDLCHPEKTNPGSPS